jgi:4-methylaminobutanoate oxidase (formaldehyde-forming)
VALEAQKQAGIKRIFAAFTTEDPGIVVPARSTIYRNGERVGYLSSAGFGYTIGKWIGYGYVRSAHPIDADFVLNGTYELEVATRRLPCRVSLEPLYDPNGERIKC